MKEKHSTTHKAARREEEGEERKKEVKLSGGVNRPTLESGKEEHYSLVPGQRNLSLIVGGLGLGGSVTRGE